jgi:hypothetical protein
MWISVLGIVVAFAVIILLIKLKRNFGIAMICGAATVSIFSLEVLSLNEVGTAILDAIISWKTIGLAVIVTLVGMIASSMKEAGLTDRLIENIRRAFPNGGVLAIIPAIFGLMPIPGGARISAPMIEDEGNKLDVSPNEMNYLNLWFRHPWPLIFPLTPSLILAAELSDIDLNSLIFVQIPVFISFILVGYLMLRLFVKERENKGGYFDLKGILITLSPILIALMVFFILNRALQIETYISISVALFLAIGITFAISKTDFKKIPKILEEGLSWKLILAIFGIMIFRNIVTATKGLESLSPILQNSPFHPLLILAFIPLILGGIIGNNLLVIGLNFILVSSILSANISVPLVSILYVSSFIGYLISPLHLCTIVSCEYFKTGFVELYKFLLPSGLAIIFINTAIMYLLLI